MMSDRRGFLGWMAALAGGAWPARRSARAQPRIEARPTALYQQPDGRRNLVRLTVAGLDAPAARARVLDRRGALVGTAGLLPLGAGRTLAGEIWVPLAEPSEFRIEVEVAKRRVARDRVRLTPPRRWRLYWVPSIHTDLGYTDVQERCLEVHRRNLDAALTRLATRPDHRWAAECALQVISFLENRAPERADALLEAIRAGKIGFHALFANLLTGLLSHETFARAVWPAGLLARERGLTYASAQLTDVPGQPLTFPTVLAASGVRYLITGLSPERALPLLSREDAERHGLQGEWLTYPDLHYWEGPDGSRVLHWRGYGWGDATRFGFADGPEEMGRRLSDWLLGSPVLLSPAWPSDIALLCGADAEENAAVKDAVVANAEEFNRRYAFPRIVPARTEDFFREVERRHGARIPVRRGDTGLYREDGAASTASELAQFRAAQLAARAADIVALWDDRLEAQDGAAAERVRLRAEERRAMWRDLLLFGEHTWGSRESVAAPASRDTVAQWAYKRRFLETAGAAAWQQLGGALLRLGQGTGAGRGRVVFNASTWERSDVARVPGAAGKALMDDDRELPAVDLPDGSALVVFRGVPALGYVALAERERPPRPLVDDGPALSAAAGGFQVGLDPATGAIANLTGSDGRERVKPSPWSGLNQLVYARGGARSALWTERNRAGLGATPQLELRQAELVAARRERLPGIGLRLVAERKLAGLTALQSTVTLYDELPWVDIENRLAKPSTLEKEALYVAFPFAFAKPTVQVEVPLGRMTVERDQRPGSCRDWFCHAHWVWLTEGTDGVLWSGPDTPLFTLNDVFRGQWRRRIEPDGTLFAYVVNNYWPTNFAARQGGELVTRFRLSLLGPGDPAEPVRRGWAACDSLYVSGPFETASPGPLIGKDRALLVADPGVLVVGAKPADDGEGAIVKLLDVAGTSRAVGIWPAAFRFVRARRTNLVEMNEDAIPVGGDLRATAELKAWGVTAVRLFTPREATR